MNGPDKPENAAPALLRTENLTRVYHSGSEEVVVFENLNLEIREGDLVALVGESGSGKTTLLHLLAALDTPTSGEVYFRGERVSGFDAEHRAIYRNQRVGYVWQMHYLLPEFTAAENIMFPQLLGGTSFVDARIRARELLAEVGLDQTLNRRVGELSGGEQQRVALARALANKPAVLLADEPTGSLDQRTAERIGELLEGVHRSMGLTLVLATHNLELAGRAQRTFRLASGRITETTVSGVR
jgi:lipoprotein-releasing system ATP-binding protein